MSECVPRGRHRLDLRVAEPDEVAVGERVVLELDTGSGWQVRSRACALHERRQARHVVGLQVRLERGDDRHALGLSDGDVVVDQVDMRIDDGEPPVRGAAEELRGASRVVVEQLPEEHLGLQSVGEGLTSYQEIS
jgi:hypothetical protein